MRHRWLSYLTLVCALLLPLVLLGWARSYMQNDTLIRVGGGRVMALDCIRGEVSFWVAPTRDAGPVRYARETIDSSMGSTATEALSAMPTMRQTWFMGFGYAEVGWLPSGLRGAGTTRCFVAPLWFFGLVLGSLPMWALWRHARRQQDEATRAAAVCRRCGAPMAATDERCGRCRFPALVKHRAVA